MRKLFLFFLLICSGPVTNAQVKSPDEFLGYKLGSRYTPHYKVLAYFDYVSKSVNNIKLQQYGSSYEGRPLMLAFITSPENSTHLEDIRTNNLKLARVIDGQGNTNQPVIVWLSYNVHGNEPVSTEAAMQTLYELVNPGNAATKEWLKNTVVIIDPCLNPDGRERYVNFFTERMGRESNPNVNSREHKEPWPGGRPNHYLFDLNRDWAWQTQQETQQRLVVYNQWMPHVHADFHEMSIDETYYFAPAAEPFHETITPWQREFQTTIGRNHAHYFDKNSWLYFTKEVFDLLYPSYGDTFPLFNGAIGMTYEQGGFRGGVSVVTSKGDTLTLSDRIAHHTTTGLSTIEAASLNAQKVVAQFGQYFNTNKTNPSGPYKTYLIKGDNPQRVKDFASFLAKNNIEYGYGSSTKKASGYNYFSGKKEPFTVEPNDLIISAYQSKSTFIRVLFEPQTKLKDSITYDLTAWAQPYAWGLKSYATNERLNALSKTPPVLSSLVNKVEKPLAYLLNWNSLASAKFLTKLLNAKVKVRYTEVGFDIGGKRYSPGSLIIVRTGNVRLGDQFDKIVKQAADENNILLDAVNSGFSDKGIDFGSNSVHEISAPRVAVLAGDDVSENAFGEVWHFFDQQLHYPIDVLETRYLTDVNLAEYKVIIVPDGNYTDLFVEKQFNQVTEWVKNGGQLILMQGAVTQAAGKTVLHLKTKIDNADAPKTPYAELNKYEQMGRSALTQTIQGSIFKLHIDNSHPLGFGYPDYYYTLKLDANLYQFLPKGGWNVGFLKKDGYVSGFVGAGVKVKFADAMVFGVDDIGKGHVTYMADNPLFRSFWENGKLLFANAVFMLGQ